MSTHLLQPWNNRSTTSHRQQLTNRCNTAKLGRNTGIQIGILTQFQSQKVYLHLAQLGEQSLLDHTPLNWSLPPPSPPPWDDDNNTCQVYSKCCIESSLSHSQTYTACCIAAKAIMTSVVIKQPMLQHYPWQ